MSPPPDADESPLANLLTVRAMAEVTIFVVIEAAVWTLVENQPRWALVLTVVIGAAALFGSRLQPQITRYSKGAAQAAYWVPTASFFALVSYLLVTGYKHQEQPFLVKASESEMHAGRPLVTMFMVGSSAASVTPIHVAMVLKLVNNQRVRSMIDSYSLETGPSARGPWTTLCPLHCTPEAGCQVFFVDVDNPQLKANTVTFGDGIMDALLYHHQIQPHDTVMGWTFWQCPMANCPEQFFRVTIGDTADVKGTVVLAPPSPEKGWPNQWVQPHQLIIGERVELANSEKRFIMGCGR